MCDEAKQAAATPAPPSIILRRSSPKRARRRCRIGCTIRTSAPPSGTPGHKACQAGHAEKAGAESNAAAREYREQQQEVLERMKAQREARLATKPLFEM
jgi:hypothetical protein